MNEFDFKDVDYCKYGFKYKKRTRLWNNIRIGHLEIYVIEIVDK